MPLKAPFAASSGLSRPAVFGLPVAPGLHQRFERSANWGIELGPGVQGGTGMGRILRIALISLCGLVSSVWSASFSNIYFFGDSLSDSGNISALSGGSYPPAPYYNGRFSNGPTWAETFAYLQGTPNSGQYAGMTLGPNFLNLSIKGSGNNYAIAGARTNTTGAIDSIGIPTGMQVQTYYYLSQAHTADPSALYVLFGGANDVRDAAQLSGAQQDQAVANAAYTLVSSMQLLGAAGARNFLVLNLPNIGDTPEARLELNDAASATAATQYFNAALSLFLPSVSFSGEHLYTFDTYSLFQLLYQDALNGGQYTGITNATLPCFAGFAGSTGSDCNKAIFSDDLHPTALVHALLGTVVNNLIQGVPATNLGTLESNLESFGGESRAQNYSAPDLLSSSTSVPEPGSLFLAGSGLFVACLLLRGSVRH
jgi:phospholipase/lecithinase/hemolysin